MNEAKINVPKIILETASSFTDPREGIREEIHNALDAGAKNIRLEVSLAETGDGQSLNIIIEDDGCGMHAEQFGNFFDLGESTKTNDGTSIGSKGVGTSTLFLSERIIVESWVDNVKRIAIADKPYATLFNRQSVKYNGPEVARNTEGKKQGTRITVEGYQKSTGENFIDCYSHPALKDYILWFTAFGSILGQFETLEHTPVIHLKSYDSNEKALQKEFRFELVKGYEEIPFGHLFPAREVTAKEELKKIAEAARENRWEEFFCKRLYAEEVFVDGLKKPVRFLIWLEGDLCKKQYNPMIRDNTKPNSKGRAMCYKVQNRYGFYASKNGVPIQRVDDWVVGRGSYTKYHAFIDYEDFSLTSNRSSIDNTHPNTIRKIKDKLNEILAELQKDQIFKDIQGLKTEADNERSAADEDAEFARRLRKCKSRKSLVLNNVKYFEPYYEGEAALLFFGLLHAFPDVLKLQMMDYNTNEGVDWLTREQPEIPLDNDNTVAYTELKHNLDKGRLNHSFGKLRIIVIYDKKGIKPGDVLIDLTGKKLMLQKVNGQLVFADYLGEVGHSIKLFVIRDFLEAQGLQMS